MNAAETIQIFDERIPMLDALGEYVVTSVRNAVLAQIPPSDRYGFFKIEPSHRVKELSSFLEKITRPGKNYRDPLVQITDQVGSRFVVLLSDHVTLVNRVITGISDWEVTRARDVEKEREENPHHFDYLSDHWVVALKKSATFKGVEILAGIPCEIQVRTLLQHAYAELAHATIYKPFLTAKPDVRRVIAKGAALVETTDEVFGRVAEKIAEHSSLVRKHLDSAAEWFVSNVGEADYCRGNETRAMRVLDCFAPELENAQWEEILHSFSSRKHVPDWLRKSASVDALFSHPVILLVFWLVLTLKHECAHRWPLDLSLLNPIFTQLGISPDGALD